MRAPIHSIKHYVQNSLETVTGGAVVHKTLIAAEKLLSVNATNEVIEGAIVKAIFIEQWVRAGETTAGSG